MISKHWNNTKFASWVRGISKPKVGTWEEWKNWHAETKVSHPIRYWVSENFLPNLQEFINWPAGKIANIKYYITNRWIVKTHALTSAPTQIKPGNWCDLTGRILPCLFNELVDFVEIETAAMTLWDSELSKKYYRPWYHKLFQITSRIPAAGIAHLEWASTLAYEPYMCKSKDVGKLTPQALAAKEILELYNWWTTVYPARVDPHTLSGWNDYYDKKQKDDKLSSIFSDKTPAGRATIKKIFNQTKIIESKYNKEDEEMLIRLIRVRQHLWT